MKCINPSNKKWRKKTIDSFENSFLGGISNAFIEESIENLREANPKYAKCYKEQRENGKRFDELKSKLSEADRVFIEKCENNNFIIRAVEQSWLYLQGYRDCIKFLKLFKVI